MLNEQFTIIRNCYRCALCFWRAYSRFKKSNLLYGIKTVQVSFLSEPTLCSALQERASKKAHLDRFQVNHCHHAILYEQVSTRIISTMHSQSTCFLKLHKMGNHSQQLSNYFPFISSSLLLSLRQSVINRI